MPYQKVLSPVKLKTMKQIIFYVILAILLFAIYGGINLSLVEFEKQNICPKVIGIPACYIVLGAFIFVLISHIALPSPKQAAYYGFLSLPFFLALGGTLTELSGKVICPRTPGGTPMCYISLGLCSTLIILKMIENKI